MTARLAVLAFLLIGGCALFPGNSGDVSVSDAAPMIEDGAYAEHQAEIIVKGSPESVRTLFDNGQWAKALENERGLAFPVSFKNLQGNWPESNARRHVTLSNDEFVVEDLLANDFPNRLEYQAWNFTGSAGSNIDYVISEFQFLETDDGNTRVIWTHKMRATSSFVQKFLGGFVTRKFAPFMEESLNDFADGIEDMSPKS